MDHGFLLGVAFPAVHSAIAKLVPRSQCLDTGQWDRFALHGRPWEQLYVDVILLLCIYIYLYIHIIY